MAILGKMHQPIRETRLLDDSERRSHECPVGYYQRFNGYV